MADIEPTTSAATAAPSAPAAPAVEQVVSTPAASSTPTSESPVTSFLEGNAQIVATETAPVTTTEKTTTEIVTPNPETPKAEGDKTAEAPKDEGNKSEKPAPLPVYEPWTLPENVTLDEKETTEFNNLLGEFQNTTKAEQAMVKEFGQNLVNKHIAAINETVSRVHESYNNAWQKQTDGWRESFINDPEIGGKRQETTVRLANEFIDTHGGSAETKAAFRKVMAETGLGVHPEVLRLLSNAMNRYGEGKPLPANPPTSSVSKTEKWYGKKTG